MPYAAGNYSKDWDGTDDNGHLAPDGNEYGQGDRNEDEEGSSASLFNHSAKASSLMAWILTSVASLLAVAGFLVNSRTSSQRS